MGENGNILFVSDEADCVFRHPTDSFGKCSSTDIQKGKIECEADLTSYQKELNVSKLDLESLDYLPCLGLTVLSEEANALILVDKKLKISVINIYGVDYKEDDEGRGLDGLAIRELIVGECCCLFEVAALWEGGGKGNDWKEPKINLHPILKEEEGGYSTPYSRDITLTIDENHLNNSVCEDKPGATDLVWHKDKMTKEWGFIVLLSNCCGYDNGTNKCTDGTLKWLQRFKIDGSANGIPVPYSDWKCPPKQICADLEEKNWDGMDWFDENKTKLILIDDVGVLEVEPTVLIIDLPDQW